MTNRKFIPEHLGISVGNIDQSVSWYHDVLGFELELKEYRPIMKSKVAFMRNGSFRLELMEHDQTVAVLEACKMPNTDIQIQGTKHICLLHDDVPALAKEFQTMKVDIVMGPVCNGVQHMIFIRDINGILIEIVSMK